MWYKYRQSFFQCKLHVLSISFTPISFSIARLDMATNTGQQPLLNTTQMLPQPGKKTSSPKAQPKWPRLTRLWTETITEFVNDLESTTWRHNASTTSFLCFCCVWAAALVTMCFFLPYLISHDYSMEHCAPDGSFRLEQFSPLEPTWFFQVVLGVGSLNFTEVKTIDIVWDVVSTSHHYSQKIAAEVGIGCRPSRADTPGIYFMESLLKEPIHCYDDRPYNLPDVLDSLYARRPLYTVYSSHFQGFHLAQTSSIQMDYDCYYINYDVCIGFPHACQCYDWLFRK